MYSTEDMAVVTEKGLNLLQHDNIDNEEERGVIGKMKEQYVKSFTIHGVSRVFGGTKGETSFWCSIVITGIFITSFGVYNLIDKYLSYEVYTALSSKFPHENAFPAITFCENNKMMAYYFSYCAQSQSSQYRNPDSVCDTLPDDPPEITNTLKKQGQWSSGIFNVSLCSTWGSRDCANDMYLKSLRRHNHTCFTWNYNGNFSDVYSHATLVFTTSLRSGNIVATIHDSRIQELELVNRVFLDSKYEYNLNIRKSVMYRLPPPFPSKCTHGRPHDIFPGKYTRTRCVDSINYISMLKQCGDTVDYIKRLLSRDILRKYKQERNLTIRETLNCMRNYSKGTIQSTNNCPVSCEELDLTTISTFHEAKGGGQSYQIDVQLLDVDSYSVITEHQVFTWDQLVGGVGGFLGLMIGASLVSLIELLVWVLLCFAEKCLK